MKISRMAVVWLVVLVLVLLSAHSQARYSDEWDALEDVMERGTEHGRIWTQSWYGIYGTSALTNAYLVFESDSSTERYTARVRAVTSSLALIDRHFGKVERVVSLPCYSDSLINPAMCSLERNGHGLYRHNAEQNGG